MPVEKSLGIGKYHIVPILTDNYIPLRVKGIAEEEARQQAQEHTWTPLALRQQEMKTGQ